MGIEDKMYAAIEKEIDATIQNDKQKRYVNNERAKEVAEMLTHLSTDAADADSLTNQYIAQIKQICQTSN